MTTLIDTYRGDDNGLQVEASPHRLPRVVGAVLHFAEQVLTPVHTVPDPALSEHFGHSQKRNDLAPKWESPTGYVG